MYWHFSNCLAKNQQTGYWSRLAGRIGKAWHLPSAYKQRPSSLRWRHNERDSVSNHQPHGCLLDGLLRRRSKKTSKLHVTGLCLGNSPGPVNSPHKGPVTRKMFPFDDVITLYKMSSYLSIFRTSWYRPLHDTYTPTHTHVYVYFFAFTILRNVFP